MRNWRLIDYGLAGVLTFLFFTLVIPVIDNVLVERSIAPMFNWIGMLFLNFGSFLTGLIIIALISIVIKVSK
ncbi:MAG: hypothetical protein ACOZAO_03315 [Patescibacteria group bacterium]